MAKLRRYVSMPLSISIRANFACSLDSPTSGATVTQGTPVTVQGTISSGAVTVLVKLGATVLGSASIVGLTWSFSWTPQLGDIGAGVLSAVATAPSGASAVAPSVAITVASSSTLRFVAKRTQVPAASANGVQSLMSRVASFATTDLASIRLAWSNWMADGSLTGVAGNVMTINASVEYPAGVFTQVRFGGAAAGTTAALSTLWSDALTVSIPSGAQFWVRTWQVGTIGILFNQTSPNTTLGESSSFPGSNQTMSGSVTANANQIFGPCAIIGLSASPSALIIGDSRTAGAGDSNQSASGAFGEMGWGLNQYAWAAIGMPGATATGYLAAAGALQADLAQYATDIVNAYGYNDINTGVSAATLQAKQVAIRALYSTKKYHVITLDTSSSSTDAWATLGNQTPLANNAARITYNTAVRADSLGFDPAFDCAAVSESSLNSGKWKVDGTANKYTGDGTHQSTFCYALYGAAGFTL